MRKSYPSDVSREQFSEIEPLLLSARKITAPRKLDLYEYDLTRTLKLEADGFQVLRFWNNEIFNAVDSVLEAIDEKLNTPHPPRKARRPLPQGGEVKKLAIRCSSTRKTLNRF